MARSSRH